MSNRKSVCLITSGLAEKNIRLQPWRYLYEVAYQLSSQGHKVTTISDVSPPMSAMSLGGNGSQQDDGLNHNAAQGKLTLETVPSINRYRWQKNDELDKLVEQVNPDVLLWHLGLPSFAHQSLAGWGKERPVIGIFPGLVYRPKDFYQLGLSKVVNGYRLSAIHVLGSMIPKKLLRNALDSGSLQQLVTQTETTRENLLACGLKPAAVRKIAPGVDPIWASSDSSTSAPSSELRKEMGFSADDTVVIYFGSPAPLRGLHSLLKALKQAREQKQSLKLLILNRRHANELMAEDAELQKLLTDPSLQDAVQLVTGFLEQPKLVQYVAAADIVALPFELVPADAPLSVLEAHALGKPVVTTTTASLPELASQGTRYLAKPADIHSLSAALLEAAGQFTNRSNGSGKNAQKPISRSWEEVGIEWSQYIQTL